jgi:hypothetical protein
MEWDKKHHYQLSTAEVVEFMTKNPTSYLNARQTPTRKTVKDYIGRTPTLL